MANINAKIINLAIISPQWYADLFGISLLGDDIQGFDTRWDQVLLSTFEVPKDSFLKSLYCTRCDCESLTNSKQF